MSWQVIFFVREAHQHLRRWETLLSETMNLSNNLPCFHIRCALFHQTIAFFPASLLLSTHHPCCVVLVVHHHHLYCASHSLSTLSPLPVLVLICLSLSFRTAALCPSFLLRSLSFLRLLLMKGETCSSNKLTFRLRYATYFHSHRKSNECLGNKFSILILRDTS